MSKVPVFLHVPKSAGTYLGNLAFAAMTQRYKLNLYHHCITVLKDGVFAYKILAVSDSKLNYKSLDSDRNWTIYDVELDKLNIDGLDIFMIQIGSEGFSTYKDDLYPMLSHEDLEPYEVLHLRDPYSRTQSLYNYLQSNQSLDESTHGVFDDLTFEEYIKSSHMEDSWLIRRLLGLSDEAIVSDSDIENIYNILDEINVYDITNIDNDLVSIFKKCKGLRYNPEDIYLEAGLDNVNHNKKTIPFEELDEETQLEFKNATKLDYLIYNRYIKATETSIITVAYDKDLEFLKYNLKSIGVFCKGYINNVIVIDDHEQDCDETAKYLKSIDQEYYIDSKAKEIKHGYVRQQWMKLFSDKYVADDANFILHIDSDSVFSAKHNPDVWFKNDKPIMLRTSYEKIFESVLKLGREIEGLQRWQKLTSEAVGFDVDYEYMRGMPLVYPKRLFSEVRRHIARTHGCSLLNYLKDKPTISEYNILGAYAYKYMRDEFYWITEDDNHDEYMDFVHNAKHKYMQHYSSRKEQQPMRYIDLEDKDNPLSKLLD